MPTGQVAGSTSAMCQLQRHSLELPCREAASSACGGAAAPSPVSVNPGGPGAAPKATVFLVLQGVSLVPDKP